MIYFFTFSCYRNLEDFSTEMERARAQNQQGEISELVIKAASYVRGSSKNDDIIHDVKRSRAMKSLLSNMMQAGSQNYQNNFELRELDEDELDMDDDELLDGDANANTAEDNMSAMTGVSGVHSQSMDGSSALNVEIYIDKQLESNDAIDSLYLSDEHGMMADKHYRDSDNDSVSTIRSIQHIPSHLSEQKQTTGKGKQQSKESTEKWNHLTNPFQQVMRPFLSLVCMPKTLRCSEVL